MIVIKDIFDKKMKNMSGREIKETFLNYFVKKNHSVIEESSLIPKQRDASALFISAGMHPLKPFLLGIEKPKSKRLCNIQRCFRTTDIDEVGIKDSTLTFFFMMGNWSIGDYWKNDAIKMAYDLLVNVFNIDVGRLRFTIFKGAKDIPKDDEAAKSWLGLGIKKENILGMGEDDNFWSAGETGPCGPCTEIYYDLTGKACKKGKDCSVGCECGRFIEIWNLVFIQYNRNENKKLEKLAFNSVDTGAGLERFALVLQNKKSVYETDLFEPIINAIKKVCRINEVSGNTGKSIKIIADHLRASCFLIADGVEPAKIERGYVLRRLIRRAIRHIRLIKSDAKTEDILEISESVVKNYSYYKHVENNKNKIKEIIKNESEKFISTLSKGLKLFDETISGLKKENKKVIDGITAFHLYDTFGFPLELTKELALERGFKVDEKSFENEFRKHQEKSRAGSEKEFRSGLAEITPETIKYHTATHLLHQALRDVLGNNVRQKGSNITKERLRFDFSHDKKLSGDEIKKVEDIVNKKIKEGLEIKRKEMTLDDAKKQDYAAFFELKTYKPGEKVSAYSIGNYSKEVCTGPHAGNTKELGKFRIIKEEAVASGIRRIKAVLE